MKKIVTNIAVLSAIATVAVTGCSSTSKTVKPAAQTTSIAPTTPATTTPAASPSTALVNDQTALMVEYYDSNGLIVATLQSDDGVHVVGSKYIRKDMKQRLKRIKRSSFPELATENPPLFCTAHNDELANIMTRTGDITATDIVGFNNAVYNGCVDAFSG